MAVADLAPTEFEFEHANAGFVTDRLLVGGDLSPNYVRAKAQLNELLAAGVTHIADLRDEWSDEALVSNWAPQLAYLNHRVADAGQKIGPEWFGVLSEWVGEALADPEAKVLVHCHMGVNRAPSAVLALLLAQGVGLRAALDAVRRARPVALIDYADSALDWHLGNLGADANQRRNARRVLARWRKSNALDKTEVIRAIRSAEQPGNRWLVRLGTGDVQAIAEVVAGSARAAIGLSMDCSPEELSQTDEVIFFVADGLVGGALVMGPMQPADPHRLLLPVLVTNLFDPVRLELPSGVAAWLAEGGNPRRLSEEEYRELAVTAADLAASPRAGPGPVGP